MKKISIVLLASLAFSCQEEVELPLRSADSRIPVIEATWSDRPFYNEVKVTLSQNYFDGGAVDVIRDAQVYVLNSGTKETIPFSFDPQSSSYRPASPSHVAQIGEMYQLFVKWEENEYTAAGEMLEPPIVDSVTYEYQPERLFRDEGYYIKVYGKIPFEDDNYYRIRVIQNDTLKNDREDYLLFDDTFGLTIFEKGLELGYDFEVGDQVRLELYRLNKEPYDYLVQLVNLLYSDGGLFSPPPQNPDTNISVLAGSTDVLGYFSVTPILTSIVIIEPEDN
ncbi:hypothetical protein J2X69_002002 [Algoriphagus sp. 4150]|uniref:DUF4249 family protein n=1 Tax=Algoriphagus sp. 4150 TaxID=2817756 RepID=UPI0028594233|nr:DUF4249 family protein [Algoriphagus sp. 4150]MDR7129657.1 hypothetical protein [Algoriphagus sp. 4150]